MTSHFAPIDADIQVSKSGSGTVNYECESIVILAIMHQYYKTTVMQAFFGHFKQIFQKKPQANKSKTQYFAN